jgi:hypothetical protein
MNAKEHLLLIIQAHAELLNGAITLRDEVANRKDPVQPRALLADLEMLQYAAAEILTNLHQLAEHAELAATELAPVPIAPVQAYAPPELRALPVSDPRVVVMLRSAVAGGLLAARRLAEAGIAPLAITPLPLEAK